MNIKEDFAKGKEGEDLVKKLLAKADIKCSGNKVRENFSYYDMSSDVGDKSFTVEVKNDLYAEKSGNIAIEIYNPRAKKKSGISITKSDLWAHIAMGEVWIAKTEAIKDYIRNNEGKKIPYAGDGNATILLYKARKIFNSCFSRIDNISGKEIYSLITDLL
jgi:hypothetical protein